MKIATVREVGRYRCAAVVSSLQVLLDLGRFARRMRQRIQPRTVYVVNDETWISEAEATRLIAVSGRRDIARLLSEVEEAAASVRRSEVAAICGMAAELAERSLQGIKDNAEMLARIQEIHPEVTAPAEEQPEGITLEDYGDLPGSAEGVTAGRWWN